MSNPKRSNVDARLQEIITQCHVMISLITDKNYEKLLEEAFALRSNASEIVAAVEALLDDVSSDEEEAWFAEARAAGWVEGDSPFRLNTRKDSVRALVSPCGRWASRLRSTGAFCGITHVPSGMLASWALVPVAGLADLTERLGPVEDREREDPFGWVESLPFSLREELSSYRKT